MTNKTDTTQFLNSVFVFATLITFVMAYLSLPANPLQSKFTLFFAFVFLFLLYLLKTQAQYLHVIAWAALIACYVLFTITYTISPEEVTRITLFIPLLAAVYFLKGKKAGFYWLLLTLTSLVGIVLLAPTDIGYTTRDVLIFSSYLVGFYLILNSFESVRKKQSDELYILNKKLKTELNKKSEELTVAVEATHQDQVTGLITRSKFTNMANFEINQAKNHPFPLSLMVLDINDFKMINVVYDQMTGDKILRNVAKSINKAIRKSDLVVRWAADEFFILLPKSAIEDAVQIAEKIKKDVTSNNDLNRYCISLSFGFAQYSSPDKLNTFIEKAEDQLVRTKHINREKN